MVKAVTQTAPDVEIGWSRRRHASRRRSDGVRHNVSLNMFEIFSLLQSNNKCLMFFLTLHNLQRPFSCFFIRRSLSFRFTFPNLITLKFEPPSFYLYQ